ncbi:hypothetical protein GWG65_18800 [Bradyrhizobium sp. CSA207]|nr:hypothetical protein [Bradyrhizobium sp. CSA207]
MLVDICRALSTSSLRAQRSNPESLRGKILDCFAALAMTRETTRIHPVTIFAAAASSCG